MSQALLDELPKPEYASMSNQAAADAINAKTLTIRVPVPTADAITHASTEGYYCSIKDASEQPPSTQGTPQSQCRAAAINIRAFVESPKTINIDMDSQSAINMKTAMAGCGFATPQQVASLDALANRTVRWVDLNGVGNQSADSIRVARDILNGATAKRDGWKRQIERRYNDDYAAIDRWQHGDPDMEF
jgi:hypothetical protein